VQAPTNKVEPLADGRKVVWASAKGVRLKIEVRMEE